MPFFECLVKQHVSVINIDISEAFLDKIGNTFETPKCQFDNLDGVSFTVECQVHNRPSVYVYETVLNVQLKPSGAPTSLGMSCVVDDITGRTNGSPSQYFHKADIKPFCKDGKFTLTVTVTLQADISVTTVTPRYIQLQTHEIIGNAEASTDATVVVGEEEIKVHRGFLSAVSPTFKTMFDDNAQGIDDGVINGMDATVVKESIDLLYGRSVEVKTIPQAIGILQFFEKYCIKGATDSVESWIADYLNFEDFGAAVEHAWKHSSEKLQKRCRAFFNENPRFALTEEYRQLPGDVIRSLSKSDV